MSIRQTDELRDALDQIFSTWPCIDLAFSLPSGAWLRPDDATGKHRRLAGLDRSGVEVLQRQLWARALSGGQGVHWRPACADLRPADVAADAGWAFAAHVLLDDLSSPTAISIIGKYRAVGIETSDHSFQAVIATTRAMTRIEQHKVQTSLVQRLHAVGRHADRGATGAGQFARLPGFPHPGRAGRTVGFLGSGEPLPLPLPLLDPDAVLSAACDTPKPARAPCGQGIPVPRPGVPGRRASGGRGKAAVDGPADRAGGSEQDYAWACARIRAGADQEVMTDTLAAAALARGKRPDEASARDYAMRTINKAQAQFR